MSNKTTLEKKYSLSHNELYELADRIIVAMRRDIADFAQFKIVQANITALELLSSEFLELLNDQIYKMSTRTPYNCEISCEKSYITS